MQSTLFPIPECFLHKRQILYICSCGACRIPNPMICGDVECMKAHGHPMQQIISVSKLQELLDNNTASMKLLMSKTQEYYREIREWLCHEIEKIAEMMQGALLYKHTHPVITLFKQQRYGQISPQKMVQLIAYLRGSKTQRKSMEFIKNQIYETLEKITNHKKQLSECVEFKRMMLVELIDAKSCFEMRMDSVNTTSLDSQNQFKAIVKMLQLRHKKKVTQWNLLFRASEYQYSAESYLLSIEGRGPFLMLFKTDKGRKFGCMANCRVDRREGWLSDGAGFSFVFSLDRDAMLPIKQEAKYRVKAMYVGDKGPQIGCGCDIYIADRCNENRESGSNLGGSFELPEEVRYGSTEAMEFLAGEENFGVVEYEVYEIK